MRRAINRLGCSTISFRHRSLAAALEATERLGLPGIDLGGLPGVCDHVPTPLGNNADEIIETVGRFDLRTWAVNVDVGPMNDPSLDAEAARRAGDALISLAARLGAALIVPCGAQSRTPFVDETTDVRRLAQGIRALGERAGERGVRLLVEGLHHYRLCHNAERLRALLEQVPADAAGFVFDVSHVVAGEMDEVAMAREFADRIEHVHLRDAVPQNINLSIGRGRADFPGVVRALNDHGYTGRYVLELETHDVAEEDREATAAEARDLIVPFLPA